MELPKVHLHRLFLLLFSLMKLVNSLEDLYQIKHIFIIYSNILSKISNWSEIENPFSSKEWAWNHFDGSIFFV